MIPNTLAAVFHGAYSQKCGGGLPENHRRRRQQECFLTGLFLAGLFLLTGCASPTPTAFPTAEPTPFILVTNAPNATPSSTPFRPLASTEVLTLTQTPTPSPNPTNSSLPEGEGLGVRAESRSQYILLAELDYAAHTLRVDETIIYTNQTGMPLDSLILIVEQNRRKDCFELENLTVNRIHVIPDINGARMEIPLEASLQPDESVTLEIEYRLNIPPKPHDKVFGYLSGFQVNLVNWYPFVAPYTHRNGWILHEPSGVGEHLVYDAADYEINSQDLYRCL